MNTNDIVKLLLAPSPRAEAVLLAVAELGTARTREISRYLGMDNSNVTRLLENLEDDGRVVVVDECDHNGGRGRPSRVWAIAS